VKTPKMNLKAILSLVLSLLIASAFSLSSLAASGSSEKMRAPGDENLPALQAPTGNLTVRGPVLLNGNEAKTGATVLSGSVLQTRTGGHATVEMGPVGRVDLDPITAITLAMTSNSIDASLDKCGEGVTFTLPAGISGRLKIINVTDVGVVSKQREIDVRVFRGEAVVKYGQNKEKTLKPGDHKEFDNAIEVTATGDAVFKVYCDENHYPYLFLLSGLLIPVIIEALGEPEPVASQRQP
jgi:hypothetical protein